MGNCVGALREKKFCYILRLEIKIEIYLEE